MEGEEGFVFEEFQVAVALEDEDGLELGVWAVGERGELGEGQIILEGEAG